MIDSLDMTDPLSDAFIYNFQNNSPLSSNPITDFNNNNNNDNNNNNNNDKNNNKSDLEHDTIDCLYQDTNIDDSIDLSINHLNFHDDTTPIKNNELARIKSDHHHFIHDNKIKPFTLENTTKTDIYMHEGEYL